MNKYYNGLQAMAGLAPKKTREQRHFNSGYISKATYMTAGHDPWGRHKERPERVAIEAR